MKLALVTGASSGLGKALSIALDKRKIPLILVARREEQLHSLAASLSLPAQILTADLTKEEERKKVIAAIESQCPDLIVNNAGFGLYGTVLSSDRTNWNSMVDLNIQAVMDLTIAGVEALKKKGSKGTILNISSAAAFFPYPTFAVYAASKAFVLRFSQAVDAETSPFGVRVLTSCPGQIPTDFRARASRGFPQQEKGISIPIEKAVHLILKQIDTGKAVSIIDWRYRLAVHLARLIPEKWLMPLLERGLRERYQ